MAKSPKFINLALQGGGAHGALAWGIIDKFLEDGRVKFDSVSATSAGAMNAAVLAHGLAEGGNDGAREALYKFWRTISDAGQIFSPVKISPLEALFDIQPQQSLSYITFDYLFRMFSPYQLNPYNLDPLRDILYDIVDFKKIKASKALKIFISATNVKTGKIKVFDKNELSADAILASACLPFLFQAVKIDSEYYWDGSYLGNPALFPLIYNSDCNDILIIHINPIYREDLPISGADILNRVNEISANSSLMREMRAVAFVTKLLDQGWIKDEYRKNMKRLYIHAIRADTTMQSHSVASKLNPQWLFINHLYEEGRREGAAWLKQNFNFISKKSSIDINEYL
jgi:NTE family protein